jgi:IS5 family transposase
MMRIMQTARRRGEQVEQALQVAYQHLLSVTEATVQQAQHVATVLHEQIGEQAQRLVKSLEHYVPLVQQVIEQTKRRVLLGEQLPASEKLVSLFEPHTAIIRKGKPGKSTEFGRVIWLCEVDGGIISRYAVLSGNPDDAEQLAPSLDHHIQVFSKPPRVLAGDRKVATLANERYAQKQGVKQVVLPKSGAKSAKRVAYERQRWFRRGCHWRAGIEGRISGLKRGQGLDRCRYHGEDGMERWVGLGLIAHDLRVIAQAMAG